MTTANANAIVTPSIVETAQVIVAAQKAMIQLIAAVRASLKGTTIEALSCS